MVISILEGGMIVNFVDVIVIFVVSEIELFIMEIMISNMILIEINEFGLNVLKLVS